jgi:hypothetical protein
MKAGVAFVLSCVCLLTNAAHGQLPVLGDYFAHDPSRIIKENGTYYVYRTSQGIMAKYSTDLRNWTYGGQVFPGAPPSWTTNAVPGFTGFFWAPDVVLVNSNYFMYYAVSSFGSQVSAIGLVTTTNLATGPWVDQGPVIQSVNGNSFNAIDPCPLVDTNGTMWMTFGSFWNGIYLIQLDPATGKRISPSSTMTHLAFNSSIEGSFLYQHGGFYYLFVNFDTCCEGIDSTYNIRVGRSTSVTGPYLDRNGKSMITSGGTMFLESTARFVGPGQAGILNDNGTNWLTYHYYDGNNDGAATLGLGQMTWSADGWPMFTNDWSALYRFSVDAREHLGLYNGSLKNGAAITNAPGMGNVLGLNAASQYALLPDPVANASTFSAWVFWSGGAAWQRIFDFGDGTNQYLYLTPMASSGNLHFAITTNKNTAEKTIEGSGPLPTNSWCQVAVTLDGTRGILYLDGNPLATNTSITVRPWQTLARSNYVGRSQFGTDPYFHGEISSFRVFSRALSAAEIRNIAYADPMLAHRYSFTNGAWDSIGMAHGMLEGNATATNHVLTLTGTPGGYVNLPGGLVSGSSSATIEFWATFGANGSWARVFDFGNISGTSGQDYLYFSPHTGTGTHRTEISTNTTVNLDIPHTLDGQTAHVVCVVDPANHFNAIYTNGVLEASSSSAMPPLGSVSTALSFFGRSLFNSDAWLNASISELRIYDGTLSPQEIAVNDEFGPDTLATPVSVARTNSGAGLQLTWPSYDVGFTLQSSTNTANPAGWSPVTNALALSNDLWMVTIPKTNGAQFFRLRR